MNLLRRAKRALTSDSVAHDLTPTVKENVKEQSKIDLQKENFIRLKNEATVLHFSTGRHYRLY